MARQGPKRSGRTIQIELEKKAWRALDPYAEPGPISFEDRRKIRSRLSAGRVLNGTIDSNVEFSRNIASELGVVKIAPDGILDVIGDDLTTCATVIAKSG